MDHLYIRLAWSFLEKEEDQYDWSRIDEVIDYWVPKGYKISFRVTAKETGDLGAAVNQKVDDVCYATPQVGTGRRCSGSSGYELGRQALGTGMG